MFPDSKNAGPEAGDDPEIKGWRVDGLDYPLLRLILLSKAVERVNQRTISEQAGMSAAQWRVLSRLAPSSGATVGDIAELVWSDRAEVSRAATALKARGLISERPNPRDRRAPLLFCTRAGRQLYERVIPLRSAYYSAMTEDLSDAERELLETVLRKVRLKIADASDRKS